MIREAGGDRSAVTGGTRVLSDGITVRITSNPGETFLDRMIALVEGARAPEDAERDRAQDPARGPQPGLPAGRRDLAAVRPATPAPTVSIPVLVALLVCLIPTTIGALLSAIGIAGMDRLVQHNVLAMSGRAVEAAGDVDTLLLDKTGTITLGNRQAAEFLPAPGVAEAELADAAQLASLADETPEGRSIVVLAKEQYGLRARDLAGHRRHVRAVHGADAHVGLDFDGREIRKGAADAIARYVAAAGRRVPAGAPDHGRPDRARRRHAAGRGRERPASLGVVHLKDVVKGGMRERFAQLRAMGIRTVMITGDNPLTAAAIATEAGVDDFLAQATPEDKLALIRANRPTGAWWR